MAVPSFDDLEGVSLDRFYTFDDPLGNWVIDQAFMLNSVVRDGVVLTVDWSGTNDIIDGLDALFARDDYSRARTPAVLDDFHRTVSNGWGSEPVSGVAYVTTGAAASDFNVTADTGTQTHSSVNVMRSSALDVGSPDVWYSVDISIPVATASGATISNWICGRYTDANNYYVARFDLLTSGLFSFFLQKRVAGVLTTIASAISLGPYVAAQWWRVELSVIGTVVKARAWPTNIDRPDWQISAVDSSLTTGNSISVQSREETGNTNGVIAISWDIITTFLPQNIIGWGISTYGQPWTMSDRVFYTDGSQGVILATTVNTLYYALMGTVVDKDFDFMVRVSAPVVFTGAKGSWYMIARWTDVNNHLRFRVDFNIDQIIGWSFESVSGGVVTGLSSGLVVGNPHVTTSQYRIRFQGYGSMIRGKFWTDTGMQPDDWTWTETDNVWVGTLGAIGVGFALSTSNTNTMPYAAYVDQFISGMNDQIPADNVSFALSFDDGMPQGANNTSNIGVGDATGDLQGPIDTPAGIYFSPFRTDQPWADFDRDRAGVAISSGVVASDGVRSRRMFSGQMADIEVDGVDTATLKALSKNRVKLRTQVQPPAVHGFYENSNATWLIAYALYKSGLYVAPPPIPGCRFYAPMNGSGHMFLPDDNYVGVTINYVNYIALNTPVFARASWIPGPFPGTLAHATAQGTAKTSRLNSFQDNTRFAPGDDIWSQSGNKGRIEFWVKGDPLDVAGSLSPSSTLCVNVQLNNPSVSRYIQVAIPSNTRVPFLNMNDGSTGITAPMPKAIPADGKWHFVGASWNISGNSLSTCVDDSTLNWLATPLAASALPIADDLTKGVLLNDCFLPIAELRLTGGKFAPKAQCDWVRNLPWSGDVNMRPSLLELESIAESQPREAFELITSLAQGELAHTGFDANDIFNYLPLTYWGEADQQLVWEDLSSDTNMGKELRVRRELTKIYNQIVLNFDFWVQEEVFSKAIESSQLLTIAPGLTTVFVIPTARPLVEPRGLSIPVVSGATLSGAPPPDTDFTHYLTANDALDGTGTYATSTQVGANITYWDPGRVEITILNNTATQWYVANNVGLPPLGIAGKMVTVKQSSATAVNSASLAARGPRALNVPLPMAQRYENALWVARELAARLGNPQNTFSSDVFGDPRRQPGQLVTMADAGQTNVSGNFRILNVSSSQTRENLKQTVSGIEVKPILIWGVTAWGESIYGKAYG